MRTCLDVRRVLSGSNDFGGLVTAAGSNISLTDTNALSAAITASGSGALVAGTNLTVSGSTGTTLTTTSTAGTTSFGVTTVGSNLTSTAGGAVSQTSAVETTGLPSLHHLAYPLPLTTRTKDLGCLVS